MGITEILKKFADDETLKFKEDKILSFNVGYLEISPNSFSIYGGNLWFKKGERMNGNKLKNLV